MERIVALVEGHTEAHFIKSIYGNAIVQRPFPNGDAVSIDLIIDSIKDALETIGGGIVKVIVMLDRENRNETFQDINEKMLERLRDSLGSRKIYLALADRQIENWILADESFISRKFENENYQYPGDGTRGKSHFQHVFGTNSISPRDRAEYLKRCSASNIQQKSPSFKGFADQIDFVFPWMQN